MLFKFAKDAGEALSKTFGNAAEGIKDRIGKNKTKVEKLEVEEAGEKSHPERQGQNTGRSRKSDHRCRQHAWCCGS